MHSAGVVPRISLDPKGTEIRRLNVPLNDGECAVTQVDGESMDAIKIFLDHFKITYTGQSLPAAVQTVLFKLMEPARQHLTEKERRELWESQKGECEKCGCTIERGEADHTTPLRDAIAGQRQSFRLLCNACHFEVTDSTARRAANPIISYFSPETYKGFVESVRPTQFVMPL